MPDSYVDSNFGQGREAVLKQLEKFGGRPGTFVDRGIEEAKAAIAGLIERAIPHTVPDEYIFFLEYYGGLAIDTEDGYFSVYGIGPMVEEDYASIISDYVIYQSGEFGFLSLGNLSLRHERYDFQHVSFYLDIGGVIQKDAVISIGPWGKDTLAPSGILKKVHEYPQAWRKISNSFVEWLEYAGLTRGLFDYF